MKILHTADWHLDKANLDFTYNALLKAIETAPEYDLFVHAGDLAVHRGHINPEVAYRIRTLIDYAHSRARLGSIIVSGNHDMNFNSGAVGMVPGILSSGMRDEGSDIRMRVVERPEIIEYPMPDSEMIASFVCIPTPSKYTLKEMEVNHGDAAGDPGGLMTQVIKGLVAEAVATPGPTYVVFHGTVSGSKLGNEMVMKAGVDLVVPADAFAGANAVLAGHIHHKQTMRAESPCPIYYPGAGAPLTWNDVKLEPAMLVHGVNTDDCFKSDECFVIEPVEEHPIPVLSQMLDFDWTDVNDSEDVLTDVFTDICLDGPGVGNPDRVRITIHAPGSKIDAMPKNSSDILRDRWECMSVKIITDRTDTATARVELEKDFTVEAAFREWCRMRGITDENWQKVQDAVISQMEASIIDGNLDANYECKPISITAKNWCQYESVQIRFSELGQVVAVTGPNYVGKSNLMRLFLFSRYKKQAAGDKLADLIRQGEDSCEVSEVFEHQGVAYRIDRTIKRTAAGGTRTDMVLFKASDTDQTAWVTIQEESASATQALIESLIGPYELFRATSYAGQNDVDGLLDLSPSDLKDVLLSVLHRDFDGRLEFIKGGLSNLEVKRSLLVQHVEKRDRLEESLDQVRQLITGLDVTVKDLEEKKEGQSATTIELDEKVEQASGQVAAAKADRQKASDCRSRMSGIQKGIDKAEAVIVSQREAVVTAEEAKGNIPESPPTLEELNTAMKTRDRAQSIYDDATRVASEGRASGVQSVQVASDDVTAVMADVGAAERKLETASNELDDAIKAGSLMDDVPCEGAVWPDDGTTHTGPTDMSTCQFLIDADMAKASIPQLRKKVDVLTGDLDKYRKHSSDIHATVDKVREQRDRQDKENTRLEKAARGDLASTSSAFVDMTNNYTLMKEAEKAQATIDGANSIIDSEQARLDSDNISLSGEQAALDLLISGDSFETVDGRLSAAKCNKDAHGRMMFITDSELKKAVETRGIKTGSAEEIANQLSTIEAAAGEVQNVSLEIGLWKIAEEAMHRDGIPYLLLEQFAIPALHQTINTYLENTDIRVSIDNERELVSGKVRSEVVLMFDDHRGRHPLSSASGFQRTAIGMALRNALADLHATATGSRIWMSIQDEGFGTMDEHNLDRTKVTIAKIAEKRGYFIFISHVGGMAEISDSEIVVVDVGGVSCAYSAEQGYDV